MSAPPTSRPAAGAPRAATEQWVCSEAARVQAELCAQQDKWRKGFTRRRFLAGSGMVMAAALGQQLVTTRHAYAAGATKTLVVVFLRGAMDGLSALVPYGDPNFAGKRGQIAIPTDKLTKLDGFFGLHPSLAALKPWYDSQKLGLVHAVGAPASNRDHFASQAMMERGTDAMTSADGWLDRVLIEDGPGTTFRAVCEGPTVVDALRASQDAVAMQGIDSLTFSNTSAKLPAALQSLYTGLDHPVQDLMSHTLTAWSQSGPLKATPKPPQNGANYTDDGFGNALADIARLVRANCGLRVATVDVGGWDVHSEAGTWDQGTQTTHFADTAKSLSAFATDLGSRLSDVTVVVMSEFGRRVAMNGSGGTDHGYGGLMMLLGGMVKGGQVTAQWPGLGPADLVQGDLRITTDYRDILGEAAIATLGVGGISRIFPGGPTGYTYRARGVMR